MKINDYDVWYSYFKYFLNFNINLQQVAMNMIELDLAELIIDSDEIVYWKNTRGIVTNKQIPLVYQENGFSSYTIPEDMKRIQSEFLFQAYQMRHNEKTVFHSDFEGSLQFIRIFLGVCYLQDKEGKIAVYPQIKIYSNGIVLLFFRRINKNCDLTVDTFVQEGVNLPLKTFDSIWVYSGIALANQLAFEQGGFYNYPFTKYLQKKRYEVIKQALSDEISNIRDNKKGFNFDVVQYEKEDSEIFTIDHLKDMIFIMVEYASNIHIERPLKRELKYVLHNYWRGTPFIYLLEFSNQSETTDQFTEEQKSNFQSILARTEQKLKDTQPLIDYRLFNDYSVFVNEATILWVLSKEGLYSNKSLADGNRGPLIYDKQIQSEMLFYILALHHKIYTISSLKSASTEDIIQQKIFANKVYRDFESASPFGEINDFLKASSKMGVDKLKKDTDLNLDLKKELKIEINTKKNNFFSWLISILFGIVGIPAFTTDFLIPLWQVTSIPMPKSDNLQKVFSYLISLGVFSSILWIIYRKTYKEK
ncbi:hypothetical protein QJ133_28255 [Priestia megaterium]|uniref:hypothetical protein n=1 Tax=Priestia megaterium TaxID=1404 RepID=UPI00249BBEC4|nr:hypothetical protein [Priestia megaterium]MDI3095021.1 hypothetical protein [Priestia megaterium]